MFQVFLQVCAISEHHSRYFYKLKSVYRNSSRFDQFERLIVSPLSNFNRIESHLFCSSIWERSCKTFFVRNKLQCLTLHPSLTCGSTLKLQLLKRAPLFHVGLTQKGQARVEEEQHCSSSRKKLKLRSKKFYRYGGIGPIVGPQSALSLQGLLVKWKRINCKQSARWQHLYPG